MVAFYPTIKYITGSYGLVCIYANMYFILGRQRFNFGPFLFHLEMSNTFFFKMTQNGLKWILNTTFEKSRLTLIILSVVLVAGSKFNDS